MRACAHTLLLLAVGILNPLSPILSSTLLSQIYLSQVFAEEIVITAEVDGGAPKYLNGNPDAASVWDETEKLLQDEVACVNIRWTGDDCGDLDEDGEYVKFLYPLALVENTNNAGESRYEESSPGRRDFYVDQMDQYYSAQDRLDYMRGVTGRTAPTIKYQDDDLKGRTGFSHNQNSTSKTMREARLYPLTLDWFTSNRIFIPNVLIDNEDLHQCLNDLPKFETIATDVAPMQLHWRIPYFTADAVDGSFQISAADCTAAVQAPGTLTPAKLNLAKKICVNRWGGKRFPLDGGSYSPSGIVAGALNAIKILDFANFMRSLDEYDSVVPSFNASRDRLQQIYPEKGPCFAQNQDPRSWAKEPQSDDEQHAVFVVWRERKCCVKK